MTRVIAPTHAPPGYDCPFCRMQRGRFDELNHGSDVVGVTDLAFARVSPLQWTGNPGNALVIPRAHHENIYDLPQPEAHAVLDLVQRVAVAMRTTYPCDGVTIRQHNEPAGGQDVWHLHVHLIPRHDDDDLHERRNEARLVDPGERSFHADLLAADLDLPRGLPAPPG